MTDYPGQLDPLDAAADSPAEAAIEYGPAARSNDIHFRQQRSKRLKISILSSLLLKPLSFIIPIVTVPPFLRYLGIEGFGLYAAVGALVLWVAMMNLGLNLGLINLLTECDVKGDRASARRYVSTLTITMAGIALVGSIIWSMIVVSVDWHRVFPTTDPLNTKQTAWAVWLGGVIMLVGSLTGIPSALYAGYQENHRANIWDGVAKVVMLICSLSVVLLPNTWGVVLIMLATSGMPTIVRGVNLIVLLGYEKPWLRPSLKIFDIAALKIMLQQGISLFVLSISVVALFQSDKLIIGSAIEPAAVAGYETLGRLFLSAYGLFILVLSPLWPAYGDAIRRGDMSWVRRQLARTRIAGCGSMALMGLFMIIFGNQVIHIWTRSDEITVSRSLILAVSMLFMVRAWADCQSVPLNAANVLVPQMFFFGSHAILNIIVALILVRHWGVEGVAWATTITGLFTTVWGYPYLIRRYLLNPERPFAPVAPQAAETS